ncbi:MAG: NTPase [Chloroflexota bacterium]|nr:NTPase [Chloroflexota bacterium]
MAKNILLTGRPGSGKTTLIQKVVERYPDNAGGFYTREIRQSGKRVGFEMITLDGQRGILAHVNTHSVYRVGKYGVDLTFLEDNGVGSLKGAIQDGLLVVIDEIGPMEIFSTVFQQAVLQALDSGSPVLATIVYRSNRFSDSIKSRSDVRLIEVRPDNRDVLIDRISNLLRG